MLVTVHGTYGTRSSSASCCCSSALPLSPVAPQLSDSPPFSVVYVSPVKCLNALQSRVCERLCVCVTCTFLATVLPSSSSCLHCQCYWCHASCRLSSFIIISFIPSALFVVMFPILSSMLPLGFCFYLSWPRPLMSPPPFYLLFYILCALPPTPPLISRPPRSRNRVAG